MIEFENAAAFFFLLVIPILYFLRYIKILTPLSFPLNLSDWGKSDFKWHKKFRNVLSFFVRALCFIAYVLLIFAFANPIIRTQEKIYSSRGADIVFVLDVSPSMAAQDIGNSTRLESSKNAIKTLMQENSGCGLGLVEMAQDAALLVPPTMDRNLFFSKLDSIRVGELGDGTAIGSGISLAIYHLEKSNAPKKAIVLITDGENNSGAIHPLTAARLAMEKSISLYVLGIGTKGTVHLEYSDPKTGRVYSGFLESNFNSKELALLASSANGKYFEVESLASLSQSLASVSKNENVVQSYHIQTHDMPCYQYFLSASILLFLLAWFIRRILLQEIL